MTVLPIVLATIVSTAALAMAAGAKARTTTTTRSRKRKRVLRRAVKRAETRGAVRSARKAKSPSKPRKKLSADHKVKISKGRKRRAKRAAPPKPSMRPREAADKLYSYVVRMIQAGKASRLGTKGRPNKTVKALQDDMGRIRDDGIYGPDTRKRGKELLGREFPRRRRVRRTRTPAAIEKRAPKPTPPEPEDVILTSVAPAAAVEVETEAVTVEPEPEEGRTATRAANDLYLYVRGIGTSGRARALGYKGHPNQTVKDAQADMGGLDDDGIYGPATRARGKELTGQTFPAR